MQLPVYHVLEPEIRAPVTPEVYDREVGVMETVVDTKAITGKTSALREQAKTT